MNLEKIVTDWYTLYCAPSKIKNLKNCVIYISYSNLQRLKTSINSIVNNHKLSEFEREEELYNFDKIIQFIRRYGYEIESDYMQTDELEYIKENNSYIVIVKDTKDITLATNNHDDLNLTQEENDTIYVALVEDAQIFTIKDSLCYIISEHKIPVFALNIKDKQ